MVKNLHTMQETRVWSLGLEDPLEKEMATHSRILAWKIPWTEEPGRLQFTVSQSLLAYKNKWEKILCSMYHYHPSSIPRVTKSLWWIREILETRRCLFLPDPQRTESKVFLETDLRPESASWCEGSRAKRSWDSRVSCWQNPSPDKSSSLPPARMSGEGSGTPLQYSCLANPMDGGAW